MLVFFSLQKNPALPGDNSAIFHLSPKLKSSLVSGTDKSNESKFLVIDTQNDYMLLPKTTKEDTTKTTSGIPVIDRGLLIKLANQLHASKDYKYVMCNVLFDLRSNEYDQQLAAAFGNLDRFGLTLGTGVEELQPAFRTLPLADASVYMPGGGISKYRLFEKSKDSIVPSFPLHMYRSIYGVDIRPNYFFSKLGDNIIFNDYRLEKFIAFKDIDVTTLGTITTLDQKRFNAMIKDKILIIDNIAANKKKTIYGDNVPISLITANAFLALEKNTTVINWYFIVFMILCCFFFSYLVYLPQGRIHSTIFDWRVFGLLRGGLGYIPTFALISVFVYFVFNNNLNLTYLGLFFYIENLIVHYKYHWRRIKRRVNF